MHELDFSRLDLRDALDLAILIEEESRERYEEFTRTVGGRYAGDAAEVFRRMVVNEQKHGAQLAQVREALFPGQARRVSRDLLDDVEAPERYKGRFSMSARRAIEIAIESEAKAFEFFSRACAAARDLKVQRLFSDLRDEEGEHRRLLEARLPDFPPEEANQEDPAEEVGSDPG